MNTPVFIKCSITLLWASACVSAAAQCAVYDESAVDQLKKINRVGKVTSAQDAELQKDLVEIRKAFNKLELAGEENEKYIKSLASCGGRKVNVKYFDACTGLRKLAINSLMQYEAARAQGLMQAYKQRASMTAQGSRIQVFA